MNIKDFDHYFIVPTFLFLGILCLFISGLSLLGVFYLTTAYVVVSYLFFLLSYVALKLSWKMFKDSP